MRLKLAWVCAPFAALLFSAPALAASPAAPLGTVEIAVTYARGAIDVFEIASRTKGGPIALPILPGATGLQVGGGSYTLTPRTATGSAALVQSATGSAQATYRVAYPASGTFLFVWHSPAPIERMVLLTGPQIHPSGLGIAPFSLGGEVRLGGKLLTSFTAQKLPRDYTIRWPFEVGDPGGWLGNAFVGIAMALPLLALVLGLRTFVFGVRRRQADS